MESFRAQDFGIRIWDTFWVRPFNPYLRIAALWRVSTDSSCHWSLDTVGDCKASTKQHARSPKHNQMSQWWQPAPSHNAMASRAELERVSRPQTGLNLKG